MTATTEKAGTLKHVLQALKACSRKRYTFPPADADHRTQLAAQLDRDVVESGDACAVNVGPFVADIAEEAGLPGAQTKQLLLELESQGLAIQQSQADGGSKRRWWPTGLSDELEAEVAHMKAARLQNLSPCPFCGGPAKAIVTNALIGGQVQRLDIFEEEDGVDVEAVVFCHTCGAQGATAEETILTGADYDQALEIAVNNWESRHRGQAATENIRADARRYRTLISHGLRFMAEGKINRAKEETDAAIDALPEPAPASRHR